MTGGRTGLAEAALLLAAGLAVLLPSCGGAAVGAGARKIKDLGSWKGGSLAMMEIRRTAAEPLLFVRWESGDRSLRLGGPWREIPMVKDVPTGDLVIVCGEPGRYNLQVWKAPEGPFDARHIGTRREIEEALGKLYPVKGR
mgnify:CR=1 FL=1